MKNKKISTITGRVGKQDRGRHESAYGDKVPICANTECVLRKKAKCFGFEGCPGFKSR